jgi:hypothetical protein
VAALVKRVQFYWLRKQGRRSLDWHALAVEHNAEFEGLYQPQGEPLARWTSRGGILGAARVLKTSRVIPRRNSQALRFYVQGTQEWVALMRGEKPVPSTEGDLGPEKEVSQEKELFAENEASAIMGDKQEKESDMLSSVFGTARPRIEKDRIIQRCRRQEKSLLRLAEGINKSRHNLAFLASWSPNCHVGSV